MHENLIGRELGNGRFKIIGDEPLGRGGFATVYLGMQVQLNRKVAIKILSASAAEDEELVRRFIREARVVAMFEHPNIIKVIDSGSEDGINYFVMNYLHGTLQALLNKPEYPEGLPLEHWLKIAKQIASALDYMHSHRTIKEFIHRDIKPGNIMFDESGNAILTDFGLVKGDQFSQLTLKDTVMGTPKYMSPEQVRGLPLDHRSDLYSFGIVLYEMLLGRPPFSGEPLTICHKQIAEKPPEPHSIKPDTPELVEKIVLKLIEKEPENRYQSARELHAELEEWENITYRSHFVSQKAKQSGNSQTMPIAGTAAEQPPDATPTMLQPLKNESTRSKSVKTPAPVKKASKIPYLLGALLLILSLTISVYVVQRFQSQTGYVTFQSEPEKASIFINNELLEQKTPWTQAFPTGDTLNLRFEFEGLQPIARTLIIASDSQTVTVKFDTTQFQHAPELPDRGILKIQSTPGGATIYVDGRKINEPTPLTLSEVQAGVRKIRLSKPGYRDYVKNIQIKPDQENVFEAELSKIPPAKPKLGRLSIVSNIWGTIWIKGESGNFGETPAVIKLPARSKPYQITVERVGYQTREGYREVVVQAGKELNLTFTLIDTTRQK